MIFLLNLSIPFVKTAGNHSSIICFPVTSMTSSLVCVLAVISLQSRIVVYNSSIYMTASYEELRKSGKKWKKLVKIGKKSAPVAPDSNISMIYGSLER